MSTQEDPFTHPDNPSPDNASSPPANPFADPTTPPPEVFKYPQFQRAGSLRQQWLTDPAVKCPIEKSTLHFRDLWKEGFDIHFFRDGPPYQCIADVITLGLPIEFRPNVMDDNYYGTTIVKLAAHSTPEKCIPECVWTGRCAPGVLCIEDMERLPGSELPYISQITRAIFQKNCSILTLRYVFVCSVVNVETMDFVEKQLYTPMNNLSFPSREERSWEEGTPEYQALLGTRIGKVVANFVLCTFDRGTKRIARIVTWYAGFNMHDLQLRFDLQSIV
ncbi:uncharacterized protein N7482_005175 [Penicillium canariense]|uniref:Uncharacterized protein n=1 Tax=Penicillium canariense TaxID=189055 RepID=A0A9W9I1W8_9EURO|nr:uncharacterized protein N7482_005175 [Penicillium canariense]KAJ5166394.1 hypothetical protein N7482_005175 [Penicillium canariense]